MRRSADTSSEHRRTAPAVRMRHKPDPETIDFLKKKIKAAAYTPNGIDIPMLFAAVDADGGGELDLEEFIQVMRTKGKLAVALASRETLTAIFDMVDLDGGGLIDVDEFESFVMDKPLVDNEEERIRAKDPEIKKSEGVLEGVQEREGEAERALAAALQECTAKREQEATARERHSTMEAAAKEAIGAAQLVFDSAKPKAKEEAKEALDAVVAQHEAPLQAALKRLTAAEAEVARAHSELEQRESVLRERVAARARAQADHQSVVKQVVDDKYRNAMLQYYAADNDPKALLMLQQVELVHGGPMGDSSKLIPKLKRSVAARREFRRTGKRAPPPPKKPEKSQVGSWLHQRLHSVYAAEAVSRDTRAKRQASAAREQLRLSVNKRERCTTAVESELEQIRDQTAVLEQMSTDKEEAVAAAPKKEQEKLSAEWGERVEAEAAKLEVLKGQLTVLETQLEAAAAREEELSKEATQLEGHELHAAAERKQCEEKLQGRVSMLEIERKGNKAAPKQAALGSKELWPSLSSASHWHSVQVRPGKKPQGTTEQARRAQRAEWVKKAPQVDFKTAFAFNDDANTKVSWMKTQLAQPAPAWRPSTALSRSSQNQPAGPRSRPGTAQSRSNVSKPKMQLSVETNVQHAEVPVRRPVSPNVMSVVMGGRPRSAHPRLRYQPESPQQILYNSPGVSPTVAPTLRRPHTAKPARRNTVGFRV